MRQKTKGNFPLLLLLTIIIVLGFNIYALANKGYSLGTMTQSIENSILGSEEVNSMGELWDRLMKGPGASEEASQALNGISSQETEDEPGFLVENTEAEAVEADEKSVLPMDESEPLSNDATSESSKNEKDDSLQEESKEDIKEETPQEVFDEAGDDYFTDALFIGDSRMVGVKLFGGLDNATFYCKEGMNVYYMLDKAIVESSSGMLTIPQALENKSFKKIYLEIGINELGTGTLDKFVDKYSQNIGAIQALQPDALIFICSIMNVKRDRSESDSIVNNVNISARNERLKELADNEHIFFVDINEFVVDEDGYLMESYSYDSVHLLGKYYKLLGDAIRKYAVIN